MTHCRGGMLLASVRFRLGMLLSIVQWEGQPRNDLAPNIMSSGSLRNCALGMFVSAAVSWAGANLKGRLWGRHKYELDALSDVCDVCSTPVCEPFSVRPEETEFCSPARGIGRDQSQGSRPFHQAGGRKADCRGEAGAGEESGGWISLLGVGGTVLCGY